MKLPGNKDRFKKANQASRLGIKLHALMENVKARLIFVIKYYTFFVIYVIIHIYTFINFYILLKIIVVY